MKNFEQSLVFRRKKHIIMQKLDGPLKGLARVSIYNSNFFAKAQYGILYIKVEYSYQLLPYSELLFSFRKTRRIPDSVGRTFKSGKDMTY